MSTVLNNHEELMKEVVAARNEIKNLRHQIKGLRNAHSKDMMRIEQRLKDDAKVKHCGCELFGWKSIGIINTIFSKKRGVPRQAALCPEAQGTITLSPSALNNPEYSLEGLEEFSHIWVMFHFHKTDSNHVRTKVAPPRLGGRRVGVFATRSPHRPCPIGLSLLTVLSIQGNVVYFSGVDMVDGTPVLDIKPYIPSYDNPDYFLSTKTQSDPLQSHLLENAENSRDLKHDRPTAGEETTSLTRVPSWILNPPVPTLKVVFDERVLDELKGANEDMEKVTQRILQQDPRSLHLRNKLGARLYQLQLASTMVHVIFDDAAGTATVKGTQKQSDNEVDSKSETK